LTFIFLLVLVDCSLVISLTNDLTSSNELGLSFPVLPPITPNPIYVLANPGCFLFPPPLVFLGAPTRTSCVPPHSSVLRALFLFSLIAAPFRDRSNCRACTAFCGIRCFCVYHFQVPPNFSPPDGNRSSATQIPRFRGPPNLVLSGISA